MRPRSASGTPVPAGLDSCSGVCPRGWLRCERPAPSPPRRRGGSRTLPRCEVSSLAPSCHCAPALPGLFFFVRIERASRSLMLRCSRNSPPQCASSVSGMRQRTHYGDRARIFSTACSSWRDAPCLLLTDLVRSVYGPVGRGAASGHATDITTSLVTHSQSSRRSSECRWRGGGFVLDRRHSGRETHTRQDADDDRISRDL
jgi:hypothetical protein